jgi:HTH-type transcriptional repressor of NAD biosynthesis genes
MTAALVIGKFYPPHLGHLHLLAAALAARPQVVLVCLGSIGDSYPPTARLSALLDDAAAAGLETERIVASAGYDETPFDLDSDPVWASHIYVFLEALRALPEVDVDTVVTSEEYGDELARRMGLSHLPCDLDRRTVPISASEIRRDPIACWGLFGPGTRSLLTARVVLLGAESTGTSTVAELLAERLCSRGGAWGEVRLVGEYGRELTVSKQERVAQAIGSTPLSVEWAAEDFADVVRTQTAREEAAARASGPALICDTDSFATPIWERRYLGNQAQLRLSRHGKGDVYLLTHPEGVPFVQDGARDGETWRHQMTDWFAEALVQQAKPWAVLTGCVRQRLALAERVADHAVSRKLTFREPL